MSTRPWYPWYPGDYLSDTLSLSLEADALYRRLLDAMWINCGLPVDKSELARISRTDRRKFCRIYDRELEHYFDIVNGKLWHTKLLELYNQASELSEKRRQSAMRRYTCNSNAKAPANGMQKQVQDKDIYNKHNNNITHSKDRASSHQNNGKAYDRAWINMLTLMRNNSLYREMTGQDPELALVISRLGGWAKVKQQYGTTYKLKNLEPAFKRAYQDTLTAQETA